MPLFGSGTIRTMDQHLSRSLTIASNGISPASNTLRASACHTGARGTTQGPMSSRTRRAPIVCFRAPCIPAHQRRTSVDGRASPLHWQAARPASGRLPPRSRAGRSLVGSAQRRCQRPRSRLPREAHRCSWGLQDDGTRRRSSILRSASSRQGRNPPERPAGPRQGKRRFGGRSPTRIHSPGRHRSRHCRLSTVPAEPMLRCGRWDPSQGV